VRGQEAGASFPTFRGTHSVLPTVLPYGMAQRDKRSVSFPPELAKAIDEAAAASGSSFSAWIAETASHRLRLEAGRRGVAAWEAEHGPLSEQELAEGLARARKLLGRSARKRSA
jgi:hypothetical protein